MNRRWTENDGRHSVAAQHPFNIVAITGMVMSHHDPFAIVSGVNTISSKGKNEGRKRVIVGFNT